jgi:hypothetical protein
MGRGRPRIIDAAEEPRYRAFVGISANVSRRTMQGFHYQGAALMALLGGPYPSARDAERWDWLLHTYRRRSIVSQHGRTPDPIAVKVFADRLCELKPCAQVAVALLRGWEERRQETLAMAIIAGETLNDDDLAKHALRASASPTTDRTSKRQPLS